MNFRKFRGRKRPNRENWFGFNYAQSKGTVAAFNEFLTEEEFHRIVELGTGKGELSIVFALYTIIRGGTFYTFDCKQARIAVSYTHLRAHET